MRFHLEASLRLSADAGAAEKAISDFIRDAGPILEKGAPEGQGAKITEWRLAKNRIDLSSTATDMFGLMMPCSGCAGLSLSF